MFDVHCPHCDHIERVDEKPDHSPYWGAIHTCPACDYIITDDAAWWSV